MQFMDAIDQIRQQGHVLCISKGGIYVPMDRLQDALSNDMAIDATQRLDCYVFPFGVFAPAFNAIRDLRPRLFEQIIHTGTVQAAALWVLSNAPAEHTYIHALIENPVLHCDLRDALVRLTCGTSTSENHDTV